MPKIKKNRGVTKFRRLHESVDAKQKKSNELTHREMYDSGANNPDPIEDLSAQIRISKSGLPMAIEF